jgi:hypothetical protein
MIAPHISVIICTHNPRPEYLARVLHALQQQTLSLEEWELLVVDNASTHLLADEVDLSWHPQARHLQESQLGLTPARMKGIRESKADILVFIDDDNVLDRDYLRHVVDIGQEFPFLAVWGGIVEPEFEMPPPEWTRQYWGMLAIRSFDRDLWSNLHGSMTAPCGAGMCMRRQIALSYLDLVQEDPLRQKLGRKGKILSSCEDTDIAYFACSKGFGSGQFIRLKLTHLIPQSRLTLDYFTQMAQGLFCSYQILMFLWGIHDPVSLRTWRGELLYQYSLLRQSPKDRAMKKAIEAGKKAGDAFIQKLQTLDPTVVNPSENIHAGQSLTQECPQ